MKRLLFVLAVVSLACGTLPQVAGNANSPGAYWHPPAITSEPMDEVKLPRFSVCADTLNLREFAGTSAPVLAYLNYGDMVTWTGRKETPDVADWYEVVTDYGVRGWINASFLCAM